MEPTINFIGSRGLLSYKFIAESISRFLDDTVYKANRKPNPNAHRIKFNRCPRKLKKAIKNSFTKNMINSYKLTKSRDIRDAIIQAIDLKQQITNQAKGFVIKNGKIKGIIYNYQTRVTFIN